MWPLVMHYQPQDWTSPGSELVLIDWDSRSGRNDNSLFVSFSHYSPHEQDATNSPRQVHQLITESDYTGTPNTHHGHPATGFLVSVIAGNGINFGILLSARYLEGRVREGLSAPFAVAQAMRASAPGTLTAAVCASVAYGSLAVTDFRAFRHFGIIGGAGMLLSWIASYTLLPALLVIGERLVPIRVAPSSWISPRRGASTANPMKTWSSKPRTCARRSLARMW